jgi:hypothetical protein
LKEKAIEPSHAFKNKSMNGLRKGYAIPTILEVLS